MNVQLTFPNQKYKFMLCTKSFVENKSHTTLFAIGTLHHLKEVIEPQCLDVRFTPIRVTNLPVSQRAQRVFCYFDQTLIVLDDGSFYAKGSAFGSSEQFQHVQVSESIRAEIQREKLLKGSICGSTLMLLYSNNQAYSLGNDRFNDKAQSFEIRKLPDKWGDIIDIAVGYSHSYLLNSNNEVICDGNLVDAYKHVLSDGDYIVKLSSGYAQVVALTHKGYAFFSGYGCHGEGAIAASPATPTLVEAFSSKNIFIEDVSCGIFHTMWLTKDKQLYITGRNTEGQLGTDRSESSTHLLQLVPVNYIQHIQAGGTSSAILTTDNRLYFAGSFHYLSSIDGDKHNRMMDLLELVTEADSKSPYLEEFASYYNDPKYEKAFSLGSAHHYVLFKRKTDKGMGRLYTILKAESLCDIEIVIGAEYY
jgi:alpha-tubulin suppressor-like RCC1 family protein